MAYDYPFQLLNAEADVPVLTSSKEATYAYITCLALLQGLVLPLSTQPNCQQFTDYEMVRRALDEAFAKIPPVVLKTIRKNQETAFDIVSEARAKQGIRPNVTDAQITKAADNFLEGLVIQYSILRQVDFEEEPLEMSAGGGFWQR